MAEQHTQTADPTDAVASGLVQLMLSMEALYNRQSRNAGLTAQQAQLLCTAARRKAGLGEIAEVLHCDRSNVSRLLDRVTRRGLAHRAADTRDGRVSVLELSPGGQAIVDSFEAGLAARLSHLIAEWPARKRQAAASILAALIDAIQRNLAEEGEIAEQSADHAAASAAARLYARGPSRLSSARAGHLIGRSLVLARERAGRSGRRGGLTMSTPHGRATTVPAAARGGSMLARQAGHEPPPRDFTQRNAELAASMAQPA